MGWFPSYLNRRGFGKCKCKEVDTGIKFAAKDVRCIEAISLIGNRNKFISFVVTPEDSYYYYRFDLYGGPDFFYSSKEKVKESIEKTLRAYYGAETK